MTPSYRPGHGNAGRAVLVSGGTSGLGLAAARRLCEEGAAVWVLGSSAASLAGESATLPLAGAGACDVSDPDAVDAAVGAAVTTMGKLDAVFVNAGIDAARTRLRRLQRLQGGGGLARQDHGDRTVR